MANSRSLMAASAAAVALAVAAAAQAMPVHVPAGHAPGGALLAAAETTVDQMPAGRAVAYVRGIQEALAERGYAPGTVDGVAGPRTRSAISAYQRDAGLAVTGNASRELLDHIKFALPKVFPKPVAAAAGPSRSLVTDIQRRLYERGYYTDTIDGLAGPNTRAAVRSFQSAAGLPVTGVVDERLKSELDLAGAAVRAD